MEVGDHMYNHFLNELVNQLSMHLTMNDINEVINQIGSISKKYEFNKKIYYSNEQLLDLYLTSLALKGIKPSTIHERDYTIYDFLSTIQIPVSEVTYDNIRYYLFDLHEKGKINKKGVYTKQCILCSFFEWLWIEKYVEYNITENKDHIRTNKLVKVHLTIEELNELKNSCKHIRDRTMIEFIYSTVANRYHVVNAKIEDIDLDHKQIKLYNKHLEFDRIAYLTDETVQWIKKYIESRNDDCPYLFTTITPPFHPLSHRSITDHILHIGYQAGFNFNVTIRTLHYTFAILSYEQGMPIHQIKELMGMKKIESINNIIKNSYKEAKEIYDEVKENE